MAQCLFAPNTSSLSERLFMLGPNDVVIHFREPIELMVPSLNRENTTWPDTVPPFCEPRQLLCLFETFVFRDLPLACSEKHNFPTPVSPHTPRINRAEHRPPTFLMNFNEQIRT